VGLATKAKLVIGHAPVAASHMGDGKAPLQIIEPQSLQTDAWYVQRGLVLRTTAGDYISVIFSALEAWALSLLFRLL